MRLPDTAFASCAAMISSTAPAPWSIDLPLSELRVLLLSPHQPIAPHYRSFSTTCQHFSAALSYVGLTVLPLYFSNT